MTLEQAAAALAAVSDTPRLDAEMLAAHAAGIDRAEFLTRGLRIAPEFSRLVERRLKGEPVAYITGSRGFWTVELEVTPAVLIPRPDSETLIEAAVAHFGERAPQRVLDLGTGSGALLLAALDQWPEATGLGVDQSEEALAVARRNGERIAPGRCEWRLGDWGEGIEERFDLVLCNPPYVEDGAELGPGVREWEPHSALFAGAAGLDCYSHISGEIPGLVEVGGIACVELGAGQFGAVKALFEARLPTPTPHRVNDAPHRSGQAGGLTDPMSTSGRGFSLGSRRDLGGHERCLTIVRK